MFLRSNSLELDNYLILPDLQYLLDYAPLVVDIQIIEEFLQDIRCTIIKKQWREIKFTSDIIKNIKKINTLHLTNNESLKLAIQEFA